MLSKSIVDQHRQVLKSVGLPTTYPRDAWQKLFPLLALDKKSRGHLLRFVALSAICTVIRIEDANESELAQAYERISS